MQHHNQAEVSGLYCHHQQTQTHAGKPERQITASQSTLCPSQNSWLLATEIALDSTAMTAYLAATRMTPLTVLERN